jgi:protein Tex
LLKVPRLGSKAYEQCAGFLRIKEGGDLLDGSAVHPEAYPVVQAMAKDLSVDVKAMIGNETLLKSIEAKKYATETIGELTIKDILNELKKPGLDPRSEVQAFEFAHIYSIDDVKVGMEVPGVVTNITRFGAFIDIGVKQDGLVHVSEISHTYITDPNEALKLNQQVKVKVVEIDAARKRIALSIKQTGEPPVKNKQNKFSGQLHGKINKAVPEPTMKDALALLKQKFGK